MTLNKQLWLSIIFVVLLNSTVNLGMLFFSAHNIFKEQLLLKNIDDATSLALILTQADKTQTNIELLMAAKFDTGHYALIELIDKQGDSIVKYTHDEEHIDSPLWFSKLISFNIPTGVAQVSDGWNIFGTLKIASQTSYAMEMLWDKFKQFLVSMVLVAIFMGGIGSALLRFILKPLDKIVYQANSFSQRRFITIKRPWTSDFAKVVDAMNSLATRFKVTVLENNKRLEEARYRSQYDPVTRLPNISAFFTFLESQLNYRDRDGQNALIIHSLANERYDIEAILGDRFNTVFNAFTSDIVQFYESNQSFYTDFKVSRINETDIAVIVTDFIDLTHFTKTLEVSDVSSIMLEPQQKVATVSTAAVYLKADEPSFSLMDRIDIRLENAQQRDGAFVHDVEALPANKLHVEKSDWPKVFEQVKATLKLKTIELKDVNKKVISYQPVFTCEFYGEEKSLSYVTSTAKRFSQLESLDLLLLEFVIEQLNKNPNASGALLIYQETISNPKALKKFINILNQHQEIVPRLSLELRESSAALHRESFKYFCSLVRPLGVQVGLKRVGKSFSEVADVHEYGLEYIKIDSAYVFDVKNNLTNQTYLRGLCDLAHSLGMDVYADSVLSDDDESILFTLGFDGVARLQQWD